MNPLSKNENIMNSINILLLVISIFMQINCQSQSKVIRDEKDLDESSLKSDARSDKISMRTTGITDWNSSKEGFIDSSTFQIKVSSLKTNKAEALEEAHDVAKRKALRLLLTETIPNISSEGKVDLRILIEEYGKIIADSEFTGEKYHFIFQIKRPALEIIVKEKIK
jgi:hypothetical protein